MGPYRTPAAIPSDTEHAAGDLDDDDSIFVPVVTRSDSHAIFGAHDFDEREQEKVLIALLVALLSFIVIWVSLGVSR